MLKAFAKLSQLGWHLIASTPVVPPLDGVAQCFGGSAAVKSLYIDSEYFAYWKFGEAAYGWVAPLKCSLRNGTRAITACEDAAKTYGAEYNWLHADQTLMKWPNLHFRFKEMLPENIECGFAAFLEPGFLDIKRWRDGSWMTRTMVGARISLALHTSCCYEFMSSYGERGGFVLTDYCIVKTFATDQFQQAFWYRNRSHADINMETRHNCFLEQDDLEFSKSWLFANLPDNNTAFELWSKLVDEGRDGFVPPWTEVYPEGYAERSLATGDDMEAVVLYG